MLMGDLGLRRECGREYGRSGQRGCEDTDAQCVCVCVCVCVCEEEELLSGLFITTEEEEINLGFSWSPHYTRYTRTCPPYALM